MFVSLSCLLEAHAPKPGNISPGRHFSDTRYEDFLAAAIAIGSPLADHRSSLGRSIKLAVEEARRWTSANTNLGIVLLLAPLARAAAIDATDLRRSAATVLGNTTVDDAREAYQAIRTAAPGGLGRSAVQDIHDQPSVTLLEAMAIASDRDQVAREYATTFETTLLVGAPALTQARREDLSWDDAVTETFLRLLATHPDSHISRRGGDALAARVTDRARDVLQAGGVRSARGRVALDEMDRALRDEQNLANPGATADLTAASIFAVLVTGGWRHGSEDKR